ncbi:hypothetical protein ANCCAN_17212 [Ancylostoma caninum]|uniref:Uncharacterized protein n=1 Tax=Ancylostoma caninum TaxID=29170 RepID=A0A368FZ83_ANCCA|nr:hypothetical protein ANCCAN_18059 [Ancylostoma caninum]RCN36901.1 hypothetical protein ANCCAN_17212 [Ancylostoma caninum]
MNVTATIDFALLLRCRHPCIRASIRR